MPVQIDPNLSDLPIDLSVSQRLSNWSAKLQQERAQKNAEKAYSRGLQDQPKSDELVQKKPQFGFIGSKTIEAYNKGARDAYIISIDRDNTEEVSRIAQESGTDLQRFNDVSDQYRKTVLSNIDPMVQADIGASLDQIIHRFRLSVQSKSIQKTIDDSREKRLRAIETYSDEAAGLAMDGNVEGATENLTKLKASLVSMVNSNDISQSEADAVFDKHARRVTVGQYKGELYKLAEQDPKAAFAQIDQLKDERPPHFAPEEWDSAIGEMMAGVNRVSTINAAQQADLTINQQAEISNLEIGAKTGIGDGDEIITRTNQLFFDGTISPEKRTSIITSVLKSQKSQKDKVRDFESVMRRFAGESSVILDKKNIDAFYNEKFQGLLDVATAQGQSPQGYKALFVDQMKYMPSGMKAEVSTYLNSGDPELITQAADLMDRVDGVPGITDQFSKNERAFAETVVGLLGNMNPQEAVRKAMELTDPSNRSRVEAREEHLKQLVKDDDLNYKDQVKGNFESWFGGVKVSPLEEDRMTNEYKSLLDAHFKAGMTLESAQKKATQLMQRNWGEYNGRAMKHPPSRYYDVAGSSDYVQKQLEEFVKKDAFGGIEYEDIILVSDEMTDRTASTGEPAYRIILLTDEGFMPYVSSESKTGVGYWKPDRPAQEKKLMESYRNAYKAGKGEQKAFKDINKNLSAF